MFQIAVQQGLQREIKKDSKAYQQKEQNVWNIFVIVSNLKMVHLF